MNPLGQAWELARPLLHQDSSPGQEVPFGLSRLAWPPTPALPESVRQILFEFQRTLMSCSDPSCCFPSSLSFVLHSRGATLGVSQGGSQESL